MAAGIDPDAPDWFEPVPVGDNGAAEAMIAAVPTAGERSEEKKIVPIDELSSEGDQGNVATTTDSEVDIIEASRESNGEDEPSFDGDIPGFTDWREELRERLKRIRARRERERVAAEAADDGDASVVDAATEEAEEPVATLEAVADEDEEPVAKLEAVADEVDDVPAGEPPTALVKTRPPRWSISLLRARTAPPAI